MKQISGFRVQVSERREGKKLNPES